MLHLGRENPKCEYRLGKEVTETSPAEKDSEVLMDEGLVTSQQCAFTAQKPNHILGCSKSSMAIRAREASGRHYSSSIQRGL